MNEDCQMCGNSSEKCICPTCPVCLTAGDETCYPRHGMVITQEQRDSMARAEFNASTQCEGEGPCPLNKKCAFVCMIRKDAELQTLIENVKKLEKEIAENYRSERIMDIQVNRATGKTLDGWYSLVKTSDILWLSVARFGFFDTDGKFVELPEGAYAHALPRWVGGKHDEQLVKSLIISAVESMK